MQRARAKLGEIHLAGSAGTAARIRCSSGMIPAAGQFVMACALAESATCRTPLFPSAIHTDGFSTIMAPPRWQLGESLDLLGPFGRRYSPPETARRWLIASNLEPNFTLQPLIEQGLNRGLEITIWGPHNPGLDPAVEIIVDLEEGLNWADYAACETSPELFASLQASLRRIDQNLTVEVLIMADLPCGFGACQACATPHKRGYKLACIDGPVFRADELGPGG